MDRIPIKVNITPSEYSGRTVRMGSPQSDIREKMSQRMREFEEESRRWREQFMSNSAVSTLDHRPKMFVNFPEFPELNWQSNSNTSIGRSGSGLFSNSSLATQNSHRSFIEEDNEGHKKYKLQFEIGEFKPNEVQVRTEGRLLIVKGERELVAGSATESKQFNREITLPDFVEPTTVTSYLCDGILHVDAPVVMERFGVGSNSQNLSIGNNFTNSSVQSSSSSTSNTLNNRRSPFRDNLSPSRSLLTTVNSLSSQQQQPLQTRQQEFQSHNMFTDGSSLMTPSSISPLSSVGTIQNSQATYKFNLSEFRPEDISITVTDSTLKIHAIREENEPRGKTYREFKRELGLPEGADVKRLKNSLQSDGILHIEVPVQEPVSQFSLQQQQSRPTLNQFNKQFNNMSLAETSNNNQSLVNERVNIGEKELKITFDLTGYRPEDVNIKCTDNTLKVHAVHIDNSKGNQIHREYSRSYVLPEWVNAELLRARMSDNGTLTVEVPLPQVQPSKLERVIKIQQI